MVVVKLTSVPFWTCVPPSSITVAVISAVPLTGTIVVLLKRVTVEPVGAVSGTLSHAADVTSGEEPEGGCAPRETRGRKRDGESDKRADAIMAVEPLTRIASCI